MVSADHNPSNSKKRKLPFKTNQQPSKKRGVETSVNQQQVSVKRRGLTESGNQTNEAKTVESSGAPDAKRSKRNGYVTTARKPAEKTGRHK